MKSLLLKSVACVAIIALVAIGGCSEETPAPTAELGPNDLVKPADFLKDDTYTTLNVEMGFGGLQPSDKAISHLRFFLEGLLNKPGGVNIITHTIPAPGEEEVIDLAKLKSIETFQRKENTKGKILTVWIMFLNSEYLDDNEKQVMSIPYGPSSIAVFGESELSLLRFDMPSRASLEKYILTHEFSHLLGLVDGGTSMATSHKADGHGNHCSNTKCLMHWDPSTSLVLSDLLGEDVVPTLDVACRDDLKAAGGK